VVAALGGSGGEVKVEDTNAQILAYAAAVAEAEGSQVHVVHAMPLYGDKTRKKRGRNTLSSDLVAYLDNVRSDIKQRCNDFLANNGLSLSDDQIHLLIGAPTQMIPEFVEANGADLVVMATVARTGIPGLVVGNASEKVLSKVGCPLLVVKSDALYAQFKHMQQIESSAA
jgi:nucleotide-binding universal stress UspA family protein